MDNTRAPAYDGEVPRLDPGNSALYWHDRHWRGLGLLQADFTTQGYAPHRHEALVVAVTEGGGSVFESRGVKAQTDASRVMVFNPEEPHAGWMGDSRRWRYRAFYADAGAMQALATSLGLTELPFFTRNLADDDRLADCFLRVHRTMQAGADAMQVSEGLVSAFSELFMRHASERPAIEGMSRDSRRLGAAIDLMRARLGGPLGLQDLGDELGLTEYQVIALFKRSTGLTPHACLTQMRLERARTLLARGIAPAGAATESGFYDQSALNRHFKRSYGITPLAYAQAVAQAARA